MQLWKTKRLAIAYLCCALLGSYRYAYYFVKNSLDIVLPYSKLKLSGVGEGWHEIREICSIFQFFFWGLAVPRPSWMDWTPMNDYTVVKSGFVLRGGNLTMTVGTKRHTHSKPPWWGGLAAPSAPSSREPHHPALGPSGLASPTPTPK